MGTLMWPQEDRGELSSIRNSSTHRSGEKSMWRPFPNQDLLWQYKRASPRKSVEIGKTRRSRLYRAVSHSTYGYAGELADRREEAAVEAESCDRECLSQYRATVLDVRARET
jgi:hypothetical protein